MAAHIWINFMEDFMELQKEILIDMYQTMYRIRKFEETVVDLFSENLIRGAAHVYLGEEAIATGACHVLKKDDYIVSTHRGHGHCIAKGGKVDKMMAEILGKSTGYCKGKGGSMHIADIECGILGANGIVGAGIPIATGAGMTSWIKKDNKVTLCFFGDGASNQVTFHESINMAAVFRLPVVFICENNHYAVFTSTEKALSVEKVSKRSISYGIPGYSIDGNDVIAVFNTVSNAVKRARKGEGPSLIECNTYRWFGHFVGDPENYRSKEEVKKWKTEKDPIGIFKKKLIKEGVVKSGEFTCIENEIQKEIEDAKNFAKNSPEPEDKELWTDILC
jgi:pyruvate dehydrogenase E1 component alpha subunit